MQAGHGVIRAGNGKKKMIFNAASSFYYPQDAKTLTK